MEIALVVSMLVLAAAVDVLFGNYGFAAAEAACAVLIIGVGVATRMDFARYRTWAWYGQSAQRKRR